MSKQETKISMGDEASLKKEENQKTIEEDSLQTLKQEPVELSLEEMLKAGLHFGHKKARWNPKMKNYIFGLRQGVHIINLEKTLECFKKALDYIENLVASGGQILIVSTKKQAKNLVSSAAQATAMPYVNQRWLGGTFTNFKDIAGRVSYLLNTQSALEMGKFADLTKLERLRIKKELEKLEEKMGGLVQMKKIPEAIFVLDVKKEIAAIKEARKKGVKIIGIVDTNADPSLVDFPIPANDDSISSLSYILKILTQTIVAAKKKKSQASLEK